MLFDIDLTSDSAFDTLVVLYYAQNQFILFSLAVMKNVTFIYSESQKYPVYLRINIPQSLILPCVMCSI